MSRRRAPTRFADLVAAATRVFIAAGGFRAAQMDDVARELGVAKGTVYLYVRSKKALFHLVLQHADGPPPTEPDLLPVPSPRPGATVAMLATRLQRQGAFPRLQQALAEPSPDRRADLTAVLTQLYDVMASNRVATRLLNSSARDVPELADFWFEHGRQSLLTRLTRLLEAGQDSGAFAALPDTAAGARLVVETTLWFAVHRHWDPRPDGIAEDLVRSTVIESLARAVSGGTAPRQP